MKHGLLHIGLLAFLAGCSGLGLVRPPDVTLVDLEFTDLTLFETSGEITLRLANENAEALALDGGVFTLFLNGVKVGKGLSSRRVEVPSFESATYRVPIYVNNLALVTRLAALLEEPVLDYRIRARLRLEVPYGTRRLTSEYRGRFSAAGDDADRLTPVTGTLDDPGGTGR